MQPPNYQATTAAVQGRAAPALGARRHEIGRPLDEFWPRRLPVAATVEALMLPPALCASLA